jgi:AcrR family transcriptional regulator
MARHPDLERRTELLDDVVAYLAEHGLTNLSLRPMAHQLGVSLNGLVHHFGSKDELVVAALERSAEVQATVRNRWLARNPHLSQADLLRRWWRWIVSSRANLAMVRLGIEAAALDATACGLPGPVRAEQIALWRTNIEHRLIAEGLPPDVVTVEASLVKAMFTGLVLDLLATGDRRRLTRALEVGLSRFEQLVWASAGLSEKQLPAATRPRDRKAVPGPMPHWSDDRPVDP